MLARTLLPARPLPQSQTSFLIRLGGGGSLRRTTFCISLTEVGLYAYCQTKDSEERGIITAGLDQSPLNPRSHFCATETQLVLLASEVEEVFLTPAVSVTEHWHLPLLDFVG